MDSTRNIGHKDERLGHVAIDMGLMTREQVEETRGHMMLLASVGSPGSFGRSALDLGLVTEAQLKAIRAEERRRRRLIHGYEIIDIIGSGTISAAYHARQLGTDREVALKILHPRLASDEVFVRAYLAEAQAVSRFHHPHIVQGYDAGQSNGFYYFACEYLPGGTIADKLRRGGDEARFSETRLLSYLRQTASALKHAWAVAVYHGDINPGNLLLDAQGSIKLANLGVPRVADLGAGGGSKGDIPPGFVRCGPDYAAPEQLDKPDLVDARTDMYSLGATFYHISFGVPPFRPPDGEPLPEFRRRNPVPSFSLERQEAFSGKYLRLLHDMLDPDPGGRPADPEALEERLERFYVAADESGAPALPGRPVPGPSASARKSRRMEPMTRAPSATAGERPFALRRRRLRSRSRLGMLWLGVVLAVLFASLALWLKM